MRHGKHIRKKDPLLDARDVARELIVKAIGLPFAVLAAVLAQFLVDFFESL